MSPFPRFSGSPTPPFALAVEGAEGPVDSSVMALFPDAQVKQIASDYLMRQGELTGVEYFGIMRGLPDFPVGVENEQYYELHRDLFRKTLADREQLVGMLKGIQTDIQALKGRLYGPGLQTFQNVLDGYDKGEIGTDELVGQVVKEASALAIPWKHDFPELAHYITTFGDGGLQSGLPTADQLRTYTRQFLQETQSVFTPAECQTLLTLAKQSNTTAYYLYLRDLVDQHQLFLAVPIELARYLEYLHTTQTVGMDHITHEVTELAFQVKLRKASEGTEKDLVQVEHDLSLLISMANVQATEMDVKAFGPRMNQFIALCDALLTSNGVKSFNEEKIRQLISSSIDYYAIALIRNKPMVDNTLQLIGLGDGATKRRGETASPQNTFSRMHNKRPAIPVASPCPPVSLSPCQDVAVLVTGGFHTESIAELLRQRNVSYVVITPTVDQVTEADQALYIKRLSGNYLTVQDVLADASRWSTSEYAQAAASKTPSVASLSVGAGIVSGAVAIATLYGVWTHFHLNGHPLDLSSFNLFAHLHDQWTRLAQVSPALPSFQNSLGHNISPITGLAMAIIPTRSSAQTSGNEWEQLAWKAIKRKIQMTATRGHIPNDLWYGNYWPDVLTEAGIPTTWIYSQESGRAVLKKLNIILNKALERGDGRYYQTSQLRPSAFVQAVLRGIDEVASEVRVETAGPLVAGITWLIGNIVGGWLSRYYRLTGQPEKAAPIGKRKSATRRDWIEQQFAPRFELWFFAFFAKTFEAMHSPLEDVTLAAARALRATRLQVVTRGRFVRTFLREFDAASRTTFQIPGWLLFADGGYSLASMTLGTSLWSGILLNPLVALRSARIAYQDARDAQIKWHKGFNTRHGDDGAVLSAGAERNGYGGIGQIKKPIDETFARQRIPLNREAVKNNLPMKGLRPGQRVVIQGDVHGTPDGLIENLIAAGVIDQNKNLLLKPGDTFIQIGDIIDRGPDSLGAYQLLRLLQDKARANRIEFHILLGNHELMVLQGNLSYAATAFPNRKALEDFKATLEKDIQQGNVVAAVAVGGKLVVHAGVHPSLLEAMAPNEGKTAAAMTQDLPGLAKRFNSILQQAVTHHNFQHPIFAVPRARGGDSPFGGIFWADFNNELKDLDYPSVIPQVVGHTPQKQGIGFGANGKVIDIDVGLADVYGGNRYLIEFERASVFQIAPKKGMAAEEVKPAMPQPRMSPQIKTSRPAVPSALQQEVHQAVEDVVDHLRAGERPTLVGKISGLTPTMEEAFRSGQFAIVNWGSESRPRYHLTNTFGGETVMSYPWTTLGLPKDASLDQQQAVYKTFQAWQEAQVKFPEGDIEAATQIFSQEFTIPYGIQIHNAHSAGEIYYVMDLLQRLPQETLHSQALRSVDLDAARDRAARFAQYVKDRGEVGVIHNPIKFDRYLLTAFLLHEFGHAVFESLTDNQRNKFRRLYEGFLADDAVFGVDFMGMSAEARVKYIASSVDEFFAENFMHFLILGKKGMIGLEGPNQNLRAKLFDFYEGIYGRASRQPRAQETDVKPAAQPQRNGFHPQAAPNRARLVGAQKIIYSGPIQIRLAGEKTLEILSYEDLAARYPKLVAGLNPETGYFIVDPADVMQYKGLRLDEGVVLGREKPGRFIFPGTVSSKHVHIERTAENILVITDLGSRNGTEIISEPAGIPTLSPSQLQFSISNGNGSSSRQKITSVKENEYIYSDPIEIHLGPVKILEIRSYQDLIANNPELASKLDPRVGYFLVDPSDKTKYKGLRENEEILIGRELAGRFDLPQSVSRRHLRVERTGERTFLIQDLGSTFGTSVVTTWKAWIPQIEAEQGVILRDDDSQLSVNAKYTREEAEAGFSRSTIIWSKNPFRFDAGTGFGNSTYGGDRPSASLTLGELFNHFRRWQAIKGLVGILFNAMRYSFIKEHLQKEIEVIQGKLDLLLADDDEGKPIKVQALDLPWYKMLWHFGQANKATRTAGINLLLPTDMKERALIHEILHILHPDWTESHVIAMTDHYMELDQAHEQAETETISNGNRARRAAKARATTADIISIIPHLLADRDVKPKEAASISALIESSRQAILGAA